MAVPGERLIDPLPALPGSGEEHTQRGLEAQQTLASCTYRALVGRPAFADRGERQLVRLLSLPSARLWSPADTRLSTRRIHPVHLLSVLPLLSRSYLIPQMLFRSLVARWSRQATRSLRSLCLTVCHVRAPVEKPSSGLLSTLTPSALRVSYPSTAATASLPHQAESAESQGCLPRQHR